jgi:hypothetical protein
MGKNLILIGLVILSAVACKNRVKPGVVHFKLMYVPAYCGGAEPSEEMKKSMSKPKLYTDTLYVYDNPGRTGEAVVIKLDEKGKYTFQGLTEGDYYFTRHKRIDLGPVIENPTNPLCKEEWYNLEIKYFSVDATTKSVTDTLNFACDPCALPMP